MNGMQEMALSNARYWVEYLLQEPEDAPLPNVDLEGSAKALEYIAQVSTPRAWEVACSLAEKLQPHMARHGPWTGWERFLTYLQSRARHFGDHQREILLMRRQGTMQLNRGAQDAAFTTYRQALRLSRRCGDREGMAVALSNLGDLYRIWEYHERALFLGEKALRIFQEVGDQRRAGYTLNHLALVYMNLRDWPVAARYLERAMQLFDASEDWVGRARIEHNLGILYTHLKKPEEALLHLENALAFYQRSGDEIETANAQLNLGYYYIGHVADPEKARKICDEAEQALLRIGDDLSLARLRHNLGMLCAREGEWEEGVRCFQRALEEWQRRDSTYYEVNSWGELGELYLRWEHFAEAAECLERAWTMLEQQTSPRYDGLREEIRERRARLP